MNEKKKWTKEHGRSDIQRKINKRKCLTKNKFNGSFSTFLTKWTCLSSRGLPVSLPPPPPPHTHTHEKESPCLLYSIEFRVIFFLAIPRHLILAGRQRLPDRAKHISAGWKEKQVNFVWCAKFKAVRANFSWPGYPWQWVEKSFIGFPNKIMRNSSIVPG